MAILNFGGDDDFNKGMMLALQMHQIGAQQQKVQQDYELNKIYKDAMTAQIREKTDALTRAEQIRKGWADKLAPVERQYDTLESPHTGYAPAPSYTGPSNLDLAIQQTFGPSAEIVKQMVLSGDYKPLEALKAPEQKGPFVVGNNLVGGAGNVLFKGEQTKGPFVVGNSLVTGAGDLLFTGEQPEKQPTIPMFIEKAVGPRTFQMMQWNPTTKNHDIPVGTPFEKDKPTAAGEGTFDKTIVTRTMMELPKLKKEAIAGSNHLQQTDLALQLLEKGVTGKGGQLKAFLAPYAEMAGVQNENLNDSQAFQLLTRAIVGPMRLEIVGPGPVSEWEQKLMQQISGGGGAAKPAAKQLINYYRSLAAAKVDNYNQTINGITQIAPNVGKVYQPIAVQQTGASQGPKTVVKKFVSPSTGKTKYVYSDGTEEIR